MKITRKQLRLLILEAINEQSDAALYAQLPKMGTPMGTFEEDGKKMYQLIEMDPDWHDNAEDAEAKLSEKPGFVRAEDVAFDDGVTRVVVTWDIEALGGDDRVF